MNCLRCLRIVCLIILSLAIVPNVFSQISIVVKPPLASVSTARDLFSADLFNNNTEERDLSFELTLSKGNAVLLKEITLPFRVKKGYNYIAGANIQLRNFESFSNAIASSGNAILIPSGEYTICINVLDVATGENITEGCTEYESSQLSPPFLIAPANESVIQTYNPILTWGPPSPLTGSIAITYKLVLVKINTGQSAAEAIIRNYPLFELSGIQTTSLFYPFTSPKLEINQPYAWKIYAYAGATEIAQTEIWTFQLNPVSAETDSSINSYAILKKIPDGSYYLCKSGKVWFKFTEDYTPSSFKIHIYDSKGNDVLTSCNTLYKKLKGDNLFVLDLNSCALKENRIYLLEAINEKNEVFKLSIKMKYD